MALLGERVRFTRTMGFRCGASACVPLGVRAGEPVPLRGPFVKRTRGKTALPPDRRGVRIIRHHHHQHTHTHTRPPGNPRNPVPKMRFSTP